MVDKSGATINEKTVGEGAAGMDPRPRRANMESDVAFGRVKSIASTTIFRGFVKFAKG